jgi:hypothetical protein
MSFFVLAKRFLSDYYAATPQMNSGPLKAGVADDTPRTRQWKLP